MYVAIVSVARPRMLGVTVTHTMSKTWRAPMMERNAQTRMVGPSSGSVM